MTDTSTAAIETLVENAVRCENEFLPLVVAVRALAAERDAAVNQAGDMQLLANEQEKRAIAAEARVKELERFNPDWDLLKATQDSLREHMAMLQALAHEHERLLGLFRQVEQHCPCGARPESLNTHPHVIGCPVEEALRATPPTPANE